MYYDEVEVLLVPCSGQYDSHHYVVLTRIFLIPTLVFLCKLPNSLSYLKRVLGIFRKFDLNRFIIIITFKQVYNPLFY